MSTSHFCVARYSVKMITRSLDQLPLGLMCLRSQSRMALALESGRDFARSAQRAIFSRSSRSRAEKLTSAALAAPTASSCASS